MASSQPRLPGTAGRRKLGRHRRQFDELARHARKVVGAKVPTLETDLTVCRGLADELDRLELDPEHSGHTFAMVTRTYHDMLGPVVERLGETRTDTDTGDALAAIRDAMAQAVPDTSTP